jgi:hypothetical protein
MFVAAALVLAAFAASDTHAAVPTIERIDVDQTVPDPDLSLICGFPVAIRAEGHIIETRFDGEGTGIIELTSYSLFVAAVANGNAYAFPAHGASLIRTEPDATEILMTAGQTSGFTGVLKIDLNTGEIILEPQRRFGADPEEVCAALAA